MDDDLTNLECECGVVEGQLHEFGCRWEYCPFCETQFIENCDCRYELLGLKSDLHAPELSYLPEDVYSGGLSAEQEERWSALCAAKGRTPFLYRPQLCARCGKRWPEMFIVQDRVWAYYTDPYFRNQVLCEECFETMMAAVDACHERPAWLPSSNEIAEYKRAWREGDKWKLKEMEAERYKGRAEDQAASNNGIKPTRPQRAF